MVSLLPTVTEPVWTSNAGAWPPLLTMPLCVAETSGALRAAYLVDVEEADGDRGDDCENDDDQDQDDGAHRVVPSVLNLPLIGAGAMSGERKHGG